jgi:tetratricopeptide (TPR) repeat protein
VSGHFWKSKVLVTVVIGLFGWMVFAQTVPSTESLYSRLLAQGKEFYENGEFDQAIAKYQSALDAAANKEEMAEAYFLLALTYYARVDMDNCQSSLDNYFSVATAGADPFLGKKLPSGFVELFKSQKREYLQKTAGTVAPSAQVKKEEPQPRPAVREQETIAPLVKKKKKFPWLLAIAATLVVGAAIYYFVVLNKKYTLTTNVGTGVDGTPATGSVKYKKGSVINYEFYPVTGYTNLVVTLDGTPVAASGTVKMDKDHTLSATATEYFVLTVAKNYSGNGTPETGIYTYARDALVNYSYSYDSSYSGYVLQVKLDGVVVAANGTITMNKFHALSADLFQEFTLTVSKGTGISGYPATGTYHFAEGTSVNYSYTGNIAHAPGVMLDGIVICSHVEPGTTCSGVIIMDKDHVLEAFGH